MHAAVPRGSYRILWIAIAVLVVNFAISHQNLRRLERGQQRIAMAHATLAALSGLQGSLQRIAAVRQQAAASADPLPPATLAAAADALELARDGIETLALDEPQQRARLTTLQADLTEFIGVWRTAVGGAQAGVPGQTRELLLADQPSQLIDRLRAQILRIEADEYRRLADQDRAVGLTSRNAMISELLATLIGLALAWAVMQRSRHELATRNHLAAIVRSTADAVASFDMDGKVLSWNAAATRLFGFTAEEMVGQAGARIVPPDRVDEMRTVVAAVREGRTLPSRVTQRLHKDGRLLDLLVTASPLLGPGGRVIGISAIAHDLGQFLAAERALKESRAQLQLIVDASPVFIIDCDRELRYRLVNKAYADRYGMPRESFVGRRVPEVVGDTAWSTLRPYVERVLGGEAVEFEECIVYQQFGERVIHSWFVPRYDNAGRLDGFAAVIQDETERHAGRRAAAELAAIVASSDDAIVGKNLDGRITSWNPAAMRLYGYTAEEVIGQPVTMLIPPELHAQEEIVLKRLRQGERIGTFETVRLAKDRRRLELAITISPILDDRGKVVGASKFARDISVRKRMEAAQQVRQQRLEIATMAAALGVFEWDIVADRAYWENDRMYEIFGRTPQDGPFTRSEFVNEVLHPSHAAEVEKVLTEGLAAGPMFQYACRIRRKRDGALRWIEFVGRAQADASGAPARLSGVVADITERRQLEMTLREADRRKDEFLAMLAHELRNPLAPLRNAAEVMRRVAVDDSRIARVQPMIERQVGHLARLIDDLLDVSRINQGKISLSLEPVDVEGLLRHALQTSRPIIDSRSHEAELLVPNEPLWVSADPVRLTQVVCNLINNAAKFTDPGGHIQVVAEASDGEVSIRVIDDGPGIDADFLPHVFDLFTQGERAADRSQGGLGIGLSLARNVTALHGGTLTAYSAGPGQGSEFVVRLPLIEPPLAQVNGASRTSGAVVSKRVLVVDDNVDAARSLSDLLTIAGHETQAVHDGPSALELAQRFVPQCVVLDIGLPMMDGYEVARRLRATPQTRDAKLIVVSGYGRDEDRQKSFEAGVDHHLVKPVDPDELEALIG